MKVAILKGITLKGENRIREHGPEWEILQAHSTQDQLLFRSIKSGYLKWGPLPDFGVVEMDA